MKNNIMMPCIEGRDCTGCSMCGAVCPTKAITIELTSYGFYEPKVDEDLCIECGLCKKVCYKFDEKIAESKANYLCYSAINKKSEELDTATSGGVSIELMKECINQGYKVVGVSYDYEKELAVTKIVSEINELEQFKGSKYFQSYTLDAFNEIIEDKSNQKYAIFGTPCQIYALRKYAKIKKCDEKFIYVDLFCHGCPSINLWKKYSDYSKKKFKVTGFDKIEFRSKVHGWHEFAFKFNTRNEIYVSKKLNDPFYELFFDMNSHNKACYECKMRSSLAYTDIRMGDFWGYQYDKDTEGVSALIIASNSGKEIFNKVEDRFKTAQHNLSDTIAAQSYGKIHNYVDSKRENALNLLASNMTLEEVIKVYRRDYSTLKKVKKTAKNIVKCLPQSVYLNLKQLVHKK